jgi:hypothetical protein
MSIIDRYIGVPDIVEAHDGTTIAVPNIEPAEQCCVQARVCYLLALVPESTIAI